MSINRNISFDEDTHNRFMELVKLVPGGGNFSAMACHYMNVGMNFSDDDAHKTSPISPRSQNVAESPKTTP